MTPEMVGWLRKSPVTGVLIVMNLSFFVIGSVLQAISGESLIERFSLNQAGLGEGHSWILITHAFLHGNLFHLAVNMAALWFTGPLLEAMLGSVQYLLLYLCGALAGGLLQTCFSPGNVDLVGASGAVCGLLAGFATLLPGLEITALIFFVVPVRMKASTLGWLIAGGSLLFWILGIEPGIGHLAHLGGAIAGCLLCVLYKSMGMVRLLPSLPPPIPE